MKNQNKKKRYNITVINYCNDKFEKTRKICSKTAKEKGKADRVIEYTPDILDNDFFLKNKEILTEKRGAGLWLWKPYIISKTLKEMAEGEYLFYVDAGVVFLKPIDLIIKAIEKYNQDIITFELPLLASEWTKRETIDYILNSEEIQKYNVFGCNQILGGYILIRNSKKARDFIDEWLNYMQYKQCIWPDIVTNTPNDKNFIEHREDQSVLTLLCKKHKLTSFKDPSQFGERPYEYAWKHCYNGRLKKYSYLPHKHSESRYPKIIISVRSHPDPIKFVKKESIISFLRKIGIYNKWTYKIWQKTSYKVIN